MWSLDLAAKTMTPFEATATAPTTTAECSAVSLPVDQSLLELLSNQLPQSIRLSKSVRKDLSEIDFQLEKGRHDPCVAVRAGVALESRMAIEIANAVLQHQAGRIHADDFKLF